MKRARPALFVATVLLCACTHPVPEVYWTPPTEGGPAFRQFSLDTAVARTGMAGLRETLSFASSSTDPKRSLMIEYAIEGSGDFDGGTFIDRLHAEVERSLETAGARVGGSEGGGDHFSVDYTQGGRQGWISVVGARLPENRYKLWCVLRESVPPGSPG